MENINSMTIISAPIERFISEIGVVLWAVFAASCYLELRRMRDGDANDTLAEVFA